jgi:hypothetical protein
MSITAVLTVFSRAEMLPYQVQMLRNQSIPPDDIWVWVNDAAVDIPKSCKVAFCNANFSYYSRYAFALLAQTDYVAIVDDDMQPGESWFANCLDTMQTHPGILGARGIVLKNKYYQGCKGYGWNENRLDSVKEVDLVGQSVFMRRSDLPFMFYEQAPVYPNGEDITLAYLAQKHGGLKCYVPAHPRGKPHLWGSTDGGWTTIRPSSAHGMHIHERNQLCREYHDNGWETLHTRT